MSEQSIIQDNAYLFGFLEDVRNSFPDADPVRLERAAVCDGLSDISQRIERFQWYLESLDWFVCDYMEDCGRDAPKELEHHAFGMSHAVDDCKRLVKDAYSVLGVAAKLIREPRE